MSDHPKHCDEYIDDAAQPECLRKYLAWARSPAHGRDRPPQKLFANLKAARKGQSFLGYHTKDGPAMKDVPLEAGQRVRVVMASRFGDVGITTNLEASTGYVTRLAIEDLENFGETP